MKIILRSMLAMLLIAITASVAFPQASSSTAELSGQVTDQSDASIPGAKVTLTDVNKGITKTATTDATGNFTFLNLLPGTYEIKIEAANFAANRTRVELNVGQQTNLPIKLATGQVQASIDVVAGTEVVETERTQQSSVIESRQIQTLPINRRNFLDYALLTPGVSSAENITDAADYRVAQTPQSGLSFGGNNGRGNSVAVDGAEAMSASGGVQATLSQEAVQEFQVVRNSYSAEFGGASGGVVNIVSKSGGNDVHGSLFGLFRNQKFDARNAFDFNPSGKSDFNRQQYGGSIGGPIRKDKTFIFGVVERLSQKKTTFINLLTDPTLFQVASNSSNAIVRQQAQLFDFIANSAAAPAALKTGAAQIRGALTTTNYARTVKLFTDASGQFPFNESQTQYSARLDHNFSDRSNGYVRFNFTNSDFENQAAGSLIAVSRGRKYEGFSGGGVASHNYQFSNTLFNELKGQFSYTRTSFLPNDTIGPELNIEGFGQFGRQIFLPSTNIERHYDIYDNVSLLAGNHTVKFGVSLLFQQLTSDSQTYLGGRFNFGTAIPTANLLGATGAAQVSNALNQFVLTAPGTPYRDANGNGLADIFEVPMTALQSFNLNLPIVYQQGFGPSVVKQWTIRNSIYAQDTWKLASNFTLNYGLRYSVNNEPLGVPTYGGDVQPRASFSWDPFKNGKTVIRGGAGIFTGNLNNAIANVTTVLGGTTDPRSIYLVLATATSGALGLPSSFTVYQTLLNRGIIGTRPIVLSDVTAAPISLKPGPGSTLEARFSLGSNYRNPTTYQASLGTQHDLGKGFSLELTYLFARGLHLSRNRDINQTKASGAVNPLNPLGGATFLRFVANSDFRVPQRFQDNIYENTANSFYHGLTAQLQRRFSKNFSLNTHYTFAKSIDEVTDYNSDWSAQNPLNVGLDRSLSAFDQRHRLVISGVLQSTAKNAVLSNWLLSPIFVGQSGRPFNLLLGFDANGDGRSQSDRPGFAGRYTGQGEAFYSVDLRLSRRFFANDRRYLELTVEAFNLANRTNFIGVNNVLGAACTDSSGSLTPCNVSGATPLTNYKLRGRRDKLPTDPLGFTSAFDPRQMQFGLRYNF